MAALRNRRCRGAKRISLSLALILGFLLTDTVCAAPWDENFGTILERTVLPGPGDRFERAVFTCWLPRAGRPVRAVIIHQHGCGNSPAATNPPVARDAHWQALARSQDCAILVPHYTVKGECAEWNDPDSGSERALFATLREFGLQAGRPELETAPWILWGHSGGSSWSVQMMVRHPGRVLAASLRGGCHKQFGDAAFRARFLEVAREVPLLFVWGQRESVPSSRHFVSWEPMQAMYRALRDAGGHVALAIDPRNEHDCGDSRLLVLPYFDAVLAARNSGQAPEGAWVDVASRLPRTDARAASRDAGAAWLPSPNVARLWRRFVETGTIVPARGPEKVPRLRATLTEDSRAVQLAWQIEPELEGGVRVVRVYRDGQRWKEIGRQDAKFLATSRDSPPFGLHVATLRDDSASPGANHHYSLAFLDGAGIESSRSAAVSVRIPVGAGNVAP